MARQKCRAIAYFKALVTTFTAPLSLQLGILPLSQFDRSGEVMFLSGRIAIGIGAANLVALILVATVTAGDAQWSRAHITMPQGSLPLSEITRRLEQNGISGIYSIDTDGTLYRIRGFDSQGNPVERRIDPLSGLELL